MKTISLKFLVVMVLCVLKMVISYAQTNKIDSLRHLIEISQPDTNRVKLLNILGDEYEYSNPELYLKAKQEALALSQKIHYIKGEYFGLRELGYYWWVRGDFPNAVKFALPTIKLAEILNNNWYITWTYLMLASIYRDMGVYPEALKYANLAQKYDEILKTNGFGELTYAVIASVYYEMNNLDSAFVYIHKSKSYGWQEGKNGWSKEIAGRIYEKSNQNDSAFMYYRLAIDALIQENNLKDLAGTYNYMASLFLSRENSDSALVYAQKGVETAKKDSLIKELFNGYSVLSAIYEKRNTDSALYYLKIALAIKEKLYGQEKVAQFVSYKFNEELQKQEIKATEQQFRNRIRIYGLLVLTGVFLMLVAIMIIRNKQKGKLNRMLQKQKEEIQIQNKELNQILTELKSTQSQLIQSEKMASLGELTAGIAHEIQNPLNFVNNFSEINKELIEELKEELAVGNMQTAEEIANDIKENEEKINHHGKRADAIVKGMLQHSRTSSGQKEPTDINALADEYLRLAYHGLRAKDKSFNADFKTNFNPNLPKINVIPQDIGRVLLNLINNAFYAAPLPPEGGFKDPNYIHKPTVTVSTSFIPPSGGTRGAVCVSVSDNGPGIPAHIIDKIFQPFFTTKPTGQGTGLGLSLAYDIVKAHGGELKVETKPARAGSDGEGEGSEFIIILPITKNENNV